LTVHGIFLFLAGIYGCYVGYVDATSVQKVWQHKLYIYIYIYNIYMCGLCFICHVILVWIMCHCLAVTCVACVTHVAQHVTQPRCVYSFLCLMDSCLLFVEISSVCVFY